MNARLQSIPYTIFPDATIDSFTNLPNKFANLYKSNVPTVAYQNYTVRQANDERDANFVRNYYYDKNTAGSTGACMCNTIVEQL